MNDEAHPDEEISPNDRQQLDELQLEDEQIKRSMACMLIGMRATHYGVSRFGNYLLSVKKLARADVDKLTREALTRMQKMSMEGFDSSFMLKNINELVSIIETDREAERRMRERQRKEVGQTPLDLSFTNIPALEAGKVYLVCGETKDVYGLTAECYMRSIRAGATISHFLTAKPDDAKKIPEVRNIPIAFWKGRGGTLKNIREIFEPVKDRLTLFDRLDALLDERDTNRSSESKRKKALRYLVRMAKRHHTTVIVAHPSSIDLSIDDVVVVDVRQAREDGQAVFYINGKKEETHVQDAGDTDRDEEKLERDDGRTEDPQELEGSGEDRGQGTGMGGRGADDQSGVPADPEGDGLEAR